jgi:O-antigen/teichoic acid export membrane protein
MLMLDFLAGSVLGFPFWIIAARMFSAEELGLGSAAISAMQLCMLLILLGTNSAIVYLLPRQGGKPQELINTAFTLTVAISAVVPIIFLLLSGVLFNEIAALASSSVYAVAFVAVNLSLAIARTFDATFTAMRRSDKVAIRSLAQGLFALVTLVLAGLFFSLDGTVSILIAWISSLLGSSILSFRYLRQALPGFRLRPLASQSHVHEMLSVSVPNFILRLSMAVPVHAIPIAVTETLSSTANAHWRAVWLFSLFVFTVPGAAGNALFAEASNHPDETAEKMRQNISFSLMIGIPLALVTAIAAPVGLQIMGEGYSAAGTNAVRVLVLGVVPHTVISTYVTRQRAMREMKEPTVFAITTSGLTIGASIVGGYYGGLTGIAVAWVITRYIAALWAAVNIRDIYVGNRMVTDAVAKPVRETHKPILERQGTRD